LARNRANDEDSDEVTMTLAGVDMEFVATVQTRQMVAQGIVMIELTPGDRDLAISWEPGAHVELVLPTGGVRQYSLCGDPRQSFLRIAVLREESGRGGSAYVHDHLHVGDAVRVRGPRNHFPLQTASSYVFVAGGVGITPILPMLRQAAANGPSGNCTTAGAAERPWPSPKN
jgi:ferredoxin-NADP reductase